MSLRPLTCQSPVISRLGLIIVVDIFAVADDLGLNDRTRADQAHFAAEYVEDLWKFVEAGTPQETSCTGHPWVVAQLLGSSPFGGCIRVGGEQIVQYAVGMLHHGAELETTERAPARADPAMAKERGTAVATDHDRDANQQGRKQGHQHSRHDLVERGLGDPAERPGQIVTADQHHDIVAEKMVLAQANNGQSVERRNQRNLAFGPPQSVHDGALGCRHAAADCDHDKLGAAAVDQFQQLDVGQARCLREIDRIDQPIAKRRIGHQRCSRRLRTSGDWR